MADKTPSVVDPGSGKLPEWFDPNTAQFTRNWRQAMPPKGGYPAIRHRYLSPGKGMTMRSLWGLVAIMTGLGIYNKKAEREHIKNLTDDFQARDNAVIVYMEAENHIKDFISSHYDKEYRKFVAPTLKLDPYQFFHTPIPGAVGEYIRRKEPKRSTQPKHSWLIRSLTTDPYGEMFHFSGRGQNKYERMLGFTVYEGPAI
jgi:hypothetical protein|eukprot:CAMPEP_0174286866 /NCGR_PEP_ID=MMETSP0809-20121228/13452_1 /TAXON_ID=73025 ORGANISM="Eutreptiella gymnastica-like, Strain CCMP1594" /NCGR_SAMPLE_ID=MMETSP0809 /ASSEMBLY_ACC=CAM_ASM_000658 /LENGTH=199 /DNA_ID=CAMNT_0015383115 /DNA_START=33 /DNA_END=632 /DNA_ORIENTATION=+